MIKYANYENFTLTIDDYRLASATVTTVDGIIRAMESHSETTFSAVLSSIESSEDIARLQVHVVQHRPHNAV
jgi:hypothetical protein